MRLFIGVELQDSVRESVAIIADAVRVALGPRVDARWIPAPNLHITLWFLGHVAAGRVDGIRQAVDRPFETSAFDFHVAGLGAFPPAGPPRVFWLGIRKGAEGLAALHADLSARLAPLGFEPERRAYSAHLTIARIKAVRGGDHRSLRRALGAIPADAGAGRASAVTLFESRLSPKGAAYEPILRVPLQ